MNNKKCDYIRMKLGFDYMFGVDSVGRSGIYCSCGEMILMLPSKIIVIGISAW
jgi:hypothetical protein